MAKAFFEALDALTMKNAFQIHKKLWVYIRTFYVYTHDFEEKKFVVRAKSQKDVSQIAIFLEHLKFSFLYEP
jgi:hypothetical protein